MINNILYNLIILFLCYMNFANSYNLRHYKDYDLPLNNINGVIGLYFNDNFNDNFNNTINNTINNYDKVLFIKTLSIYSNLSENSISYLDNYTLKKRYFTNYYQQFINNLGIKIEIQIIDNNVSSSSYNILINNNYSNINNIFHSLFILHNITKFSNTSIFAIDYINLI